MAFPYVSVDVNNDRARVRVIDTQEWSRHVRFFYPQEGVTYAELPALDISQAEATALLEQHGYESLGRCSDSTYVIVQDKDDEQLQDIARFIAKEVFGINPEGVELVNSPSRP